MELDENGRMRTRAPPARELQTLIAKTTITDFVLQCGDRSAELGVQVVAFFDRALVD